jgi:hypothetical protein
VGHLNLYSLTMTSPAALADEFSRSADAVLTSAFSSASAALTTPHDNTTLTNYERPDIPHPAYERMQPRWEKCRALMAGTEAMREGGEIYLPRMEAESDAAYAARLNGAALFNAFARTVKACAGLVNQKEPQLGDDMPARLVAMWENVDRSGTHGAVMVSLLTLSGLTDGFAGIFVDYPRADDPSVNLSLASAAVMPGRELSTDDETKLGLGPYFVRFRADDVIKAVYQVVSGIRRLILLVLREASDRRVGSFGIETVLRYRVYRDDGKAVTYELWERMARTQSVPLQITQPVAMTNVKAIPWSPFIAGDVVDQNETRPPLNDLADLNIEHFQVKTNIRNLESLALVPTMVRVGATPDAEGKYPPIVLGPRTSIEAPAVQGVATPIYWLSPNVTVLEPSNKSLANIEQQMGAAGLAFLNPELRRAETAEAKRIDASVQNASLVSLARALQDCIETAFMFAGQYINEPAGSVTINTDFEEVVMDPTMIAQLVAARQSGNLSIETFLALLEKGRVLDDGFDIEGEKKRILEENVNTLKSMGVDNGNPPPGDGTGSPNH